MENMDENKLERPLHIAMYSWFAFGHLTSFLHLANKLTERGHKVSFFLPPKTQPKLIPHNHHPHLITFIPIQVPSVEGLPTGAETAADVPIYARSLIMEAMDINQDTIGSLLSQLKPDLVFFDFTEWLPMLAREHGVKSICYASILPVCCAYLIPGARGQPEGQDLTRPPPGFPDSKLMISLRSHEARAFDYTMTRMEFGGPGKSMAQRFVVTLETCDAIAAKGCREMDAAYCDYVQKVFSKPFLLAGPVVPEPPADRLDDHLDQWLSGFDKASVVYCALGSECFLSKDSFQELLLGLELTGMPFLAALKLPIGCETLDSALPEGFAERTKGRGVVHNGWVQQQLVLRHSSVGCFVTHCGAGSLSEAMVSDCQLVLLPQAMDQFLNARMISLDLKIGVDIEKGEDGSFSKEAVCKAIKATMEIESKVGKEVKINHAKWREFLLTKGLEESYISELIENLRSLIG